MSLNNDLFNFVIVLEYVDLVVVLYLVGGSDYVVWLLVVGVEQLLGDLVKLFGQYVESDQVQFLLVCVVFCYEVLVFEFYSYVQMWQNQFLFQCICEMVGLQEDEVCIDIVVYLCVSWYMFEFMGFEVVIFICFVEVVEMSIIIVFLDI